MRIPGYKTRWGPPLLLLVLLLVGCACPTSPTAGTLQVIITGLPNGAAADVTVTGPGGFNQHLTASTTLADLPPGDYTVSANRVTADWWEYTPTPPTQSVFVLAEETRTVHVTYAADTPTLRPYTSDCANIAVGSVCDVQIGLFNTPTTEAYSGLQFDVVLDGFAFATPSGASPGILTGNCIADNGSSTVGVICATPFTGGGEAVVLHLVRTASEAGTITVTNARLIKDTDLTEKPVAGGTLPLD